MIESLKTYYPNINIVIPNKDRVIILIRETDGPIKIETGKAEIKNLIDKFNLLFKRCILVKLMDQNNPFKLAF